MLHAIYGHNYCSIAALVRTKSCYEVFKYAQMLMGDDLPGEGVGQVGKTKKRNMRYAGVALWAWCWCVWEGGVGNP